MSEVNPLRIGCLQMNSTASVHDNLAAIERDMAQAPKLDLLVLPENFAQMPTHASEQYSEMAGDHTALVQSFLLSLAAKLDCVVVAGSLAIREEKERKPFSRCLIVSPTGVVGQYDKLHLFDVEVQTNESTVDLDESTSTCKQKQTASDNRHTQRYQESRTYQAGALHKADLAPIKLRIAQNTLRLGPSICYDLRFPELYRVYAGLGVDLISVPSAFTVETGRAHWEVLLKARAIENQAFVVAAAQVGEHANGRKTWGHSMVINPWGEIVAQLNEQTGLLYAQVDLNQKQALTTRFPVLSHRRLDRL